MRYLKKYKSHEDIHDICHKYMIRYYTINNDMTIDVDGSVPLGYRRLDNLPLKFGIVNGGFFCHNNYLTNLKGSAKSVDNDFNCHSNKLTSLESSPESVGGNFYCSYNRLTSLVGCPKSVGGDFNCSYNRLTSLVGCPKSVGGDFNCVGNEIDTFEGLDFINIGGDFCCEFNLIWEIWRLFKDHTKFEFFNDCDIIRENQIIILDRLNFFLDYIGKGIVTEVKDYKCI